jgi:Protein of unknown function (DUF3489)
MVFVSFSMSERATLSQQSRAGEAGRRLARIPPGRYLE